MATRTVSVKLEADIGQYQSAVTKAAATTKGLGDSASMSGTRAHRGFDLAGKGGLLLAGAAGGAALGLKGVLTAASDLNETMNKSAVIFGDNAGQIDRWADDAARNFGLSKAAAMDAAAGFGNMFQQLGFAGDEATSASQDVVKLAADLGSFNNLGTEDVLQRIAAGFRGEYDSLQLLIPNINAARVESEAMATTGKENAKQLTAQEKAAAVLAIVNRDGAAAANDFAETSDGLANSTKIAAAEFEDLQAKIGQAFLPVATGAMHFLSGTAIPVFGGLFDVVEGVAGAFGDLPEPVQTAVVALTAVALLKSPVSSAFETIALKGLYMKDSLAGASLGMGGLKAAGSGLLGVLGGPWGLAITGAVTGLSLLVSWLGDSGDSAAQAAAAQGSLADALRQTKGAIDDTVRAAAAKDLQDSGLLKWADEWGVAAGDLVDAALGSETALDRVRAGAERYAAAQRDAGMATSEEADATGVAAIAHGAAAVASDQQYAALLTLLGVTESTIAGQDELAGATAGAGAATDIAAAAVRDFAGEANAADQAISSLQAALDELSGKQVTMLEAEFALQDAVASAAGAIDNMTGSVLSAAGGLNAQSEAGRAAGGVLLDVRDKGNELIATMIQQGATAEDVAKAESDLRASFIASAGQMGITGSAAEALADQILGIPSERKTRIDAETARAAAAISGIQSQIDALRDKRITITTVGVHVDTAMGGGTIPERAAGGPVWAGQTFLVGEQGPELVRFGGAGTVIPAPETRSMLGGLSGRESLAYNGLSGRESLAQPVALPTFQSREFSGGGRGAVAMDPATIAALAKAVSARSTHISAVAAPNERALAASIVDRQRDLEFLHG